MFEEQFSVESVNFETLDAALRATLGEAYQALTVSPGLVRVFLSEALPRSSIQAIIDAHDPLALSPEQQAEVEAAAALEAARANHAETLNLSQFATESEVIQALAGYVAWLELELRDLRGL